MAMIDFGEWSRPKVPHKGWICVGIEDLGYPDHTCEMCEHAKVRYVHCMTHPDYPGEKSVGCYCAGSMEEDYVGAKKRESEFKRIAIRKSRWLSRNWRTSMAGNDYINVDDFIIVIYSGKYGGWSGRITDEYGKKRLLNWNYKSSDEVKLAAFDVMINWRK